MFLRSYRMSRFKKSSPQESIISYIDFENVADDENSPKVRIVVSQNRAYHDFYVPKNTEPITETPHREIQGRHAFFTQERYARMDEETEELYFTLKSLYMGLRSISIMPHELSVGVELTQDTTGYLSGQWPDGLDQAVINSLARHMRWSGDVAYESRATTWLDSGI